GHAAYAAIREVCGACEIDVLVGVNRNTAADGNGRAVERSSTEVRRVWNAGDAWRATGIHLGNEELRRSRRASRRGLERHRIWNVGGWELVLWGSLDGSCRSGDVEEA